MKLDKWYEYEEVEEAVRRYIAECPFCDREIKGNARVQVIWNMKMHIERKHKDEIGQMAGRHT